MSTEILGPGGRPCPQCGTALALDQRYCLACGARTADARLAFAQILAERERPEILPAVGATPAGGWFVGSALPREETVGDRLRANTGLIAGVGVLLLAMLIGVMIGSRFGDDGDLAKALAGQKPQIIQVGGAAPAAAAPVATTAADTSGATTNDGSPSPAGKKASSSPAKPSTATNGDLKKLDGLSGKEYQKQIDKLGKNISTGGKAPPKDNKPAAGGGDFEEIG